MGGQDGTINYLNLPAITDGLRFLSAYLPFLPLRLSSLTRHLIASLSELRHDTTGTPVVQILSRRPGKDVKNVGEQSDTGSVVALLFLFVSTVQIATCPLLYLQTCLADGGYHIPFHFISRTSWSLNSHQAR